MTEHQCIDCKAEPPATGHVRNAFGTPLRCATHTRAFQLRQRKQKRATRVEKTYGISAEDNHELYLLQGGKCWLCQKATGATKSLAVDHDHATGEVRGRLCGPCNQFIGRLRDDPAAAERLVAYLTGDTPYRRLKAAQTLTLGATKPVVVIQVVPDSYGQIYADWKWADRPEELSHRTVVRTPEGVWGLLT